MRYVPCWKQIGITQDRYQELLHFCRQYPTWKMEANSMMGTKAISYDGLPHSNRKGDPVVRAVEKREKLLAKIALVEECAKAISDCAWYATIMQNVCYGVAYDKLDITLMPTSNRNDFFKQRRLFFELLNQKKD